LEKFKAEQTKRGPRQTTQTKALRKSIGNSPATEPTKPERISTGPAARIVGVSNKTLLRLARRGKVPGAFELVEGEGPWRFDERRLRDWVRRREAKPLQEGTISTRRTAHDRPVLRSEANIDVAYERLFEPKRSSDSKRSRSKPNT
jgi:hypothetical protein